MINEPILAEPKDIEAEQAVLGSIIEYNELADDIIGIITYKDFYSESHQHIFKAIIELSEENKPIDEILIADKLKENEKLEGCGGMAYIIELVDCAPSSGNIVYYAHIIKDHSILRDIIETSKDIAQKSRDPQQSVSEILKEAEKRISEISLKTEKKSCNHIKDILLKSFGKLEELSENKSSITGIPSGFIKIDEYLHGFQPSDLIILAARPSIGKTAIALNIANYASKWSEIKGCVLIFSMEMSEEQLSLRMLSSESKVPFEKIVTGKLEQEDWDKIAMSTEKLSMTNLHINDSPNLSPFEVSNICKNINKKNKVSMVVIDYLQLMRSNGIYKSREQEISEISRSMKGIAKEMNIPIIALSQLNRKVEERKDKRPQLSDLRESGSLEQDADIVMFLYRDEYYDKDTDKKGVAEVLIKKHRNGKTGTVELAFRGPIMKFANLEYRDIPLPSQINNPNHWSNK